VRNLLGWILPPLKKEEVLEIGAMMKKMTVLSILEREGRRRRRRNLLDMEE
jgi:hypothetical protein